MKLSRIPQFARNANRVREIVTILSKYGLADWVSRLDLGFARGLFRRSEGPGPADVSHETRIRLVLTELGTTFIKLGQMLSTRADLVGPDLARELTKLQAAAPADPPDVTRALVLAELGKPVGELFEEFEDTPLASASIGQVHRARLKPIPDPSATDAEAETHGRRVVVKVQHAGIIHRVRDDLEILVGLAELAERYIDEMKPYRPHTTALEFRRVMTRELDFRREQRHLEQFARAFARDPSVRFPRAVPGFCTSRVLTMDWLDGIPVSDPDRLREAGYDLDEIARRGARVFLEMIFRDGFYHADPHPGNILVLAGGTVGMLDGGMVGRLDEATREHIGEMLAAVARGDTQALAATLLQLTTAPPDLDEAALGSDLGDFLAEYAAQPLDRFDLAGALNEITDMVRRHGLILPPAVALLLKVLVMLEGTGRLLSPRFNLTGLIQPYYRTLVLRRLSPARHLRRLGRFYQELEQLGEVLPRGLIAILRQALAGTFAVRLEHHRLEPSVNRLVFGLLTSSLFLGSAQLWAAGVAPAVGGVSVPGAAGCAVSLLMALRLLSTGRPRDRAD